MDYPCTSAATDRRRRRQVHAPHVHSAVLALCASWPTEPRPQQAPSRSTVWPRRDRGFEGLPSPRGCRRSCANPPERPSGADRFQLWDASTDALNLLLCFGFHALREAMVPRKGLPWQNCKLLISITFSPRRGVVTQSCSRHRPGRSCLILFAQFSVYSSCENQGAGWGTGRVGRRSGAKPCSVRARNSRA